MRRSSCRTRTALRRILDDISLELRRGEFLTVVGPSGTGKTTLLRVLGGLTPCTRGAVQVNGQSDRRSAGRRGHRVPGLFARAAAVADGRPQRGIRTGRQAAARRDQGAGARRAPPRPARRACRRLSLATVRRHAAARADRARAGAASGGSADGRTVCGARRHDQGARCRTSCCGCATRPARASCS